MFNELNTLTFSGVSWAATWPTELTGELVAFTLLLCFVGLSNLEKRFPKISRPIKLTRQSYQTNISLFAFNNLLMSACSISTLYMIADHYSGSGLLSHVSSPALKVILSFLAFDLLLYFWHQACHCIDVFWLFHRVHHNDPDLNVSTAFRLHFVEVLITNILKVLLIIILGINSEMVLAIETFVTMCILFHHTNFRFKYERALGYFMIVPYLHRVHHSTERSEHDRNYGAALSVWDRMFGSFLELEPKQLGIKGSSPLDLFSLLKLGLGFETPTHILPANLDEMIAEAAFYKAERRNFYPGYDLRDWLEAKKEIMAQVYGNKSQQSWAGYCKLMMANFTLILKQSPLFKDFMPVDFL
jgi:sterol desaturase/sphingolipid hydroxylase (fatty acid hydroxylase superfamily)